MLAVAPVSTLFRVLRRFLQVELQSVQEADGIEALPRLAEREAELLVVRDRALEVVDEKLRSEGRDARLDRGGHRCPSISRSIGGHSRVVRSRGRTRPHPRSRTREAGPR